MSVVKDYDIKAEIFNDKTDLGKKKFDIITVPHVMYYFLTFKERSDLFKHFNRHLNPGGVIWCLLLAETDGQGKQSAHYLVYKEVKKLVSLAKYGFDENEGKILVTAESLWKEWKVLGQDLGLECKQEFVSVL